MFACFAGGHLLLLEHARSTNQALAAYQDFTSSAVATMGKGCTWNQKLPELLKEAGLFVLSEEHHLAGTISCITAIGATY
jgi:hypothetical protein